MASLDKMAVRGIRSFDDKSIHMIQFFSPLTVIVGYNGSGKTTIIECLKYATTGDLPPNTKGGAFVHDPNMATSHEVKAQVRLRFYNTNKVRINCVRNLQVTKKRAGGLTMKTLESLLQVDDENKPRNKRTTLSTKCAELDEEIPRLLGVSKAILENVIFCHQEESNWPLSEPASLKKKFDDIFEATRYTKALDNIKSLRKDRGISLKVQKAELEGLKTDKDRADALKEKTEKMSRDLDEKETRLARLNAEIEELTKANKELYDKATKFRETVQRAETLEEKKSLHVENMNNLKSTMTPLDELESELQRRKEKFREHLDGQRRRQDELRRRIETKKDELSDLEARYNRKLSEKGGLEAERKNHERAIKQREESIRKMSADLGIKGFDFEGLSDAQAGDFAERVQDDARKLESDRDTLRKQGEQQEANLSSKYYNLQNSLKAKEGSREHAMESIKRLKDRLKKTQEELETSPVTRLELESAEKEHKDLASKLEELIKQQVDADYDGKIRIKNNEIRELDDRREEYTSELNSLQRHADFRAKLDMKKKSVAQKRQDIQALLERHDEAIKRFTESEVNAETVETEVAKATTAKEKVLTQAERVDQDKNKKVQHVESTLTFARTQLKDKEERIKAIVKEIDEALEKEFDSVEDAIQESQKEIDWGKDKIATYKQAGTIFDAVMKQAKNQSSCLACGRDIKEEELDKVTKHIQDLLAKSSPAQLAEWESHVETWSAQVDKFLALMPREAQAKQMREEEMPQHEADVKDAEAQLQSLSVEAEKSTADVEALKAELRELGNLKRVASDVSRLTSEIEQLQREINTLETDLTSTGTTRTGDEVQQEINDLADTVKKLKREVQSLTQDKESKRTLVSSTERNIHQAELLVSQKRRELEKQDDLAMRLEEIRAEHEDASQRVKNLERDIAAAMDPIRKAKEELDKHKKDQSKREQEAQTKVEQARGYVRQLTESESAVQSYIQSRGEQRLQACSDALTKLQGQIRTIQNDISGIESEVAKIEKDLNESRATERNIHDNLRYLALGRDIERIDSEMAGLQLEEASKANKIWSEKFNVSKRKENELNGEASHLAGENTSLKATIKSREQELRDEYKNVHGRYTAKLIDVKTSELANSDLELYQKALQAAIMKFHAIKMEEINQNLNYLWGRTYQGTDIDTISIRADGEGTGARTYNYRVCMIKDSVEMDMRGRCSAGQKCLASILIRLALADSFSAHCGIMALDEPTTNLDKENIDALSQSLCELINERRSQSNFQLIVITHDEDFLSRLGQTSNSLDWYFRVSRDARQRSIIERERIK